MTREAAEAINNNIHPNKTPGFDVITEKNLKQLPRKTIVMHTYLINNATFRLKYVPRRWKVAEMIMIIKPGKPPNAT